MRLITTAMVALLASSSACAPAPNSPRLGIEGEVRAAFADSLVILRTGTTQQALATVADNFVLKTESEVLARDAALKHLPADRQILAFDHVTQDSAVVTSDDLDHRYVEVWVRTGRGWRLARMNELRNGENS
jgi:hypothetical protein